VFYNGNVLEPVLHQRRLRILSIFLAAFFLILVSRVWYLQILRGSFFKEKSEKQRIRVQRVLSPRGEFVDRQERTLVDTKPGFNVTLTLEDVQDLDQSLERLSQLVNIPEVELRGKIETARANGIRRFQMIRLLSNVDWPTVALLEAHQMDLGGISVSPEPLRNYRFDGLFAHAFGYMGEINGAELGREAFSDYRMGDVIGKTGLEKRLERYLKGVDGSRQVEVNSLGRIIQEMAEHSPVPGSRIVLTVDYDIQHSLEEAFGDASGAGVVLNPNTGEILAMVSRPSYDPNVFSGGIPAEKWKELTADEQHPLTNKAISGQYAPGSVFKIVMAVAGLEERAITPQELVYCRGYTKFGGRRFRCWKRRGHGKMDLHRALVQSCDVYFYELGQRLGIDKIAEHAQNLGLNRPTGIDLEGEKPGLIPTRVWKKKTRKEPWYPGENLNAAIGQGYILVTPIQLANLVAAIANGGTVYRPQLVKRVEDYRGEVVNRLAAEVRYDAPLSAKTLQLVTQALEGVVSEKRGTGGRVRMKGIRVAGKTGTAQVVRMKQDEEESEDVPEKYRDHALFAAFAPVDDPEIAVAIIVEHGGHGGSAAAPIAGQVLERYFTKTGLLPKPDHGKDKTPVERAEGRRAVMAAGRDN
jgi:penicillin-binding protein 2